MMATELYVKIGDLTRGCGTRAGLEDYLPCSGFELDVAGGRDPERTHAVIKPMKLVTDVSRASPRLFELACAQRPVDIEILFLRYDEVRGEETPYYRYRLRRARVVGLSQRLAPDVWRSLPDDAPPEQETLSLVADEIIVEHLWSETLVSYPC
jgi:type VI protein secretion system component Hcp